jgi:cytochrome P450
MSGHRGLAKDTIRSVLDTYSHDTARYYAALRALSGRRQLFWDDDLQAWVITSHSLCQKLLVSPALSKSRLRLDTLSVPQHLGDLARHTQSVIDQQMAFDESPAAIRSHQAWARLLKVNGRPELVHRLEREAEAAWASFETSKSDFYREVLRPYVSRAVAAKLLLREEERSALYRLIYGYADFLDGKSETGSVMGAIVSVSLLSDYVSKHFDRLRQCSAEPIDDQDRWIADYVLTLVAGHESTAFALAVSLLAAWKQDKIARSPIAIRRHMLEALRYDSPIQMIGRVALTTLDLGIGATIRAGERIFLHVGVANRDPEQFDDPDRFCPHRPSRGLLSFGLGASRCVGMNLSLTQAQLFLSAGWRVLGDRRPSIAAATFAHGLAGRSFERLSLAD